MEIALTKEQYIEYLINCEKEKTVEQMKSILSRCQSDNINTFRANIVNELLDDLYLLRIELEELLKYDEED